jgi:hypothetical protein
MVKCCVLFEVRAEFLNAIQTSLFFERLNRSINGELDGKCTYLATYRIRPNEERRQNCSTKY